LRSIKFSSARHNMLLSRPVRASRYGAVKLENGHGAMAPGPCRLHNPEEGG
jgi:hypothetical protein